ncbi:hypothetical protein LCGC14_2289170 [marine sediment metagenome]|uniref:Uncharacterized protein n=1 Tax=marine sediment metagenome TaxID=412755 RepID=A0A0F9F496_9ZZZZ
MIRKFYYAIAGDPNVKALKRLQPIVEQGRKANRERLQTAQQTEQSIQQLGRDVAKMSREGRAREEPAEDETLEKLDAYAAVFQTLASDSRDQGKWGGARSIILDLSQELGDPSLLSEFEPRLENLRDGAERGNGWRGDLVKRITAKAREKWEAEERPKIEKQILARLEKEGRAVGRQGSKPPAKPLGGGGGRKRTVEEIGKMTAEQVSQLPDDELDEALTAQ